MKAYESDLEEALVQLLAELGYEHVAGDKFAPGGDVSDARRSFHDVVLMERLQASVARINSTVPLQAQKDAIARVTDTVFSDLVQENRRIHDLIVNGIGVSYLENGETKNGKVWLVDWHRGFNDWLAVSQLPVVGESPRRLDIVIYLNGIPLIIIELKAPEADQADILSAYQQIATYRSDLPELFRFLAFSVVSDGLAARYGTLSADFDRYMRWRTVDGEQIAEETEHLALVTLARGLLNQRVLLDMLRRFTVFEDTGTGIIKKMAGYHQYYAATKGLHRALEAVQSDGRGGVMWHTQGSGKSLLMAFFAGLLVHEPKLGNPTIVVVTDRNDLDQQLFDTFSACSALFGQKPEQAENAEHMRKLLSRDSGGVIFTTVQKFRPEKGKLELDCLTDRRNVILLVDEAHRSQYGFEAKIHQDTGKLSYGFAHQVRRALPNATLAGFTGTPVELGDRNTPVVFGDYIDVYDVSAAVEDGATVPIYYEARVARIELAEDAKRELVEGYEEATENLDEPTEVYLGGKWSRLEALMGSEQRLDRVVDDILNHFDARLQALDGKAMIVCMSRRICVEVYERIVAARPQWHDADDKRGSVKVVMTGSASDPIEFKPHIRSKGRQDEMADRFRDPADSLKLVIVRNMWLTGFDAPCLHTLYIDKPTRGHDLMQTIARVNRVFGTKPGGLIVDYIGVAAELKQALSVYSSGDQARTGVNRDRAISAFLERIEILRSMFHGFDYQKAQTTNLPLERLRVVARAADFVFKLELRDDKPLDDKTKKAGRKRFMDAALALIQGFKLSAGSPEASAAIDEVAFFCAVRAAILKLEVGAGGGRRNAETADYAIQQLVNQAVASTEVVDILAACGLDRADVSLLSEQFLIDLKQMPQKNLAVEALRKLLAGEVAARTRTNLVRQREFGDRLQTSIAKYHNRTVDAVQVLQELIELARALREQPDDGLTSEEIAFYDALAANASAVEVMGNDQLRALAAELVREVRANVRVDWWKSQQARSFLRLKVKRLLKRYGYPPNLEGAATDLLIQQAEALASEVAHRTVREGVPA